MKLYILTHCAAEENYTPRVFKKQEDARKALKLTADDLIYWFDETRKTHALTDNFEIYEDAAEIIYDDDTYDRLDIFEVEVEDQIFMEE